ncbi:MAG: cell shape determination protein CcmA [Spirochaetales bacterium]|nr:cell shape determination protein CcmA [Spirochaetales bacterium]
MAELRLRTIDEAEIETIIGEDIEFSGTLTLDHPSLIKGKVDGTVNSTSDVYIHQAAAIDAHLTSLTLSVKGTLSGTVKASKRIELYQSGTLSADIETPDLFIQSGSLFNGRCTMVPAAHSSNETQSTLPDPSITRREARRESL